MWIIKRKCTSIVEPLKHWTLWECAKKKLLQGIREYGEKHGY
nr:MAG TPA: hypothetical protein [Caudoviricetes sp.]